MGRWVEGRAVVDVKKSVCGVGGGMGEGHVTGGGGGGGGEGGGNGDGVDGANSQ